MASQAMWRKSSLKQNSLIPYISKRTIPERNAHQKWRIPLSDAEPLPFRGEFVVFTSFLDCGLSFPTSLFLRRLLRFYRIKLHDLGPHSIQQIAFFVSLCEGWLGCPPYFPLWLAIVHGRAQRGDNGELIPSGGITFQMQGGKLLEDSVVKVELPGKAKNSWRRDWFYYREETPAGEVAIPPYTSEPSRPRRLGVKKLPEDLRAVVDLMLARLCKLKKEGLKPINVYNCWMGRFLPPLKKQSHLMCDYTGEYDSTRTSHEEWEEKDYATAVALITKASFSLLDEPLQPFDKVDRPLPEVKFLPLLVFEFHNCIFIDCTLLLFLRSNPSGTWSTTFPHSTERSPTS